MCEVPYCRYRAQYRLYTYSRVDRDDPGLAVDSCPQHITVIIRTQRSCYGAGVAETVIEPITAE